MFFFFDPLSIHTSIDLDPSESIGPVCFHLYCMILPGRLPYPPVYLPSSCLRPGMILPFSLLS
jgi:hypothetical protein